MSVQTWLAEFMPVPADKVEPGIPAIKAELLMWEGLRPENREQHGLVPDSDYGMLDEDYSRIKDENGQFLPMDGALCLRYGEDLDCYKCPLPKILGHCCCNTDEAPLWHFWDTGDPEPMIAALKKAEREATE